MVTVLVQQFSFVLGGVGSTVKTHVVHVTRCQCELRITARGPLRSSCAGQMRRLKKNTSRQAYIHVASRLRLFLVSFFASVWLLWSHGTRRQSTRQDVDDALRLDWEASKGQAKFVFLLGVEMC